MPALLALVLMMHLLSTANCNNETNFTNCDKDITVLERALYSPENIKQLNRIFYPPRETTSRFIMVNYEFENTKNEFVDYNCNVTYIWAVGGFLLMQPPKIFQLTSLYFSTPANELTNVTLKLPRDCWHLAHNGSNNCTCMCENNDLDIITQQVSVQVNYESVIGGQN